MRALPNMTVLVPVDAVETARWSGLWRSGWAGIYPHQPQRPAGTHRSRQRVSDRCSGHERCSDVAVFANGVMVSKALAAAEELAEEGISVKVINASTVKPLADEEVLAHVEGCRGVVTAEEHSVIGGLGSAVACALRRQRNLPIEFVGVKDSFGKSAPSYS